ncbi:hypothetical protein [Roseibium polysiphoniae]|uniref:hypothetical protein n=1 Tax=Roseibium polysiphoniae TaxID=2571221 RepID=UPI003298C020
MTSAKSDDRIRDVFSKKIDRLIDAQKASYEGWCNSKFEDFKRLGNEEKERIAANA